MVILFLPLQLTRRNICVQTTSGVISTDHVPPEGWDGRAPQGCIIPLDFPSQSLPSWPMNYVSLPVVGNYPEPVSTSNKENEVRHSPLAMVIQPCDV